MARLLRYDDALIPDLIAISYVLGGYVGGLLLILSDSPWRNGAGVLLLAHAMVIAAYLLHECAAQFIGVDGVSFLTAH